ncbi:DUF998 domain-containing protein [Sphaerisporangium sp. TRM90804]|uniref:DUF998 domain-containing protein n=1 Tax=Sphaerisporangium sp. TRM90804 TaxID=3031113 RepID=UPI0024491279|nr:DUF998 domain-containing protein [Sphaerisporangium sp. TRM90804]MDH2424698.1 DUF998 domain-containing protein [Sphaerisporangium sp. TRM90804]
MDERSARERVLLGGGAVGAAFFVVVFLVTGAVREGYDPVRHPVSALALGEFWWTQAVNFVVTGVLFVGFAFGLRTALRRLGGGVWAPLLIGLVGIGLIGAGVFPTDPVSGYPPGTPGTPVGTLDGFLHDLFSLPVFVALPAACCVVAVRFAALGRRGWAVYSVATAVVFLAGFVVAGLGFSQEPGFVAIGGLTQRLTLVVGWTWIALLALRLLRGADQPSPLKR